MIRWYFCTHLRYRNEGGDSVGIPQIIVIAIYAICLGVSLADDGKTKMKEESFLGSLIAEGIMLGLLWWGGFFG